jgi:hypothetical protein
LSMNGSYTDWSDIWRTLMRFQLNTFLAAALALAASPALAAGAAGSATPGPIAGAGLGFLVLAGGYYAFRRWRKGNPAE